MKAVLVLVALATALVALGGAGWITCRVYEADGPRIVFQWILVGAIGVTLLALGCAMLVGVWHLYLFLVAGRKPDGLFASVPRDDQ